MKKYGYILAGLNIISAFAFLLAGTQIADSRIRRYVLLSICVLAVFNLAWYVYFRRRFVSFTDEVCICTEDMIKNKKARSVYNKETLTSKMVMDLEKLEDIYRHRLNDCEKDKAEIKQMISDITHQLKTPLANMQMYQDMLSDPDMDDGRREQFTGIIRQQLKKLEFLIDALIMSSRLESEMIKLNYENASVFQTLAKAVNAVAKKAEKKQIDVIVDVRPTIQVIHDVRWTAEALENILDNAVKYTKEKGKIIITASLGEMYTNIKIKDTGTGIAPEHINDIFKRFYREKSVSRTEGLGLGLYLARNIITLQGGYILVHSVQGEGSAFTVFLPNRKEA